MPQITVKNYTKLYDKYGFIFKRTIWNTTYEQLIITDGVARLKIFNDYIVADLQKTASYLVRELWQDKKLLEREIITEGKWQGLPIHYNLYKTDNIEPEEIDFTLKGQKRLKKGK